MMLDDVKQALADNLSELLKKYPNVSRLDLSRRMNVADGTLGRIKYGTGNPQLENICQIADFFKLNPWQLLVKNGHKLPRDYDPFKQPLPSITPGHIRVPLLDASPSAGPGGEPVDWPAVLDHIDIAEGWARKHLGSQVERIRALPVQGDSMSPTINEGDLAFVDVGCTHFDAEGIYIVVFNQALLIKRLSADFSSGRIKIQSDNGRHETQFAREEDLTICGRVKAWLAIKGY